MATQETQKLDAIIASRRELLKKVGMTAAGAALATAATSTPAVAQSTNNDTAILTFALNLEYLEAQFYTLAASGVTADSSTLPNPIGTGAGTAATGGATVITKGNNNYASCKVPFISTTVQSYANEIAFEERNHVIFLRNALSTGAVAQPSIDLYNSFIALGKLLTPAQASFDPFALDPFFLLGSYIFEDVGVSAYHGAAPLITDKINVLAPAAAIHATEAYHAGLIRTSLYQADAAAPGMGYLTLASSISSVRAKLDGTGSSSTPDDIGLGFKTVALETSSATYNGTTQINADANYLCWARTTAQVLAIVYAGGAAGVGGGFFPKGLNGTIR